MWFWLKLYVFFYYYTQGAKDYYCMGNVFVVRGLRLLVSCIAVAIWKMGGKSALVCWGVYMSIYVWGECYLASQF